MADLARDGARRPRRAATTSPGWPRRRATTPRPAWASSVRGALALIRIAKVWAASHGRHYVTPDDIKHLARPVWRTACVLDPEAEFSGTTADTVITRVLEGVAAPQARAVA